MREKANSSTDSLDVADLLKDYFNLSVNLSDLYRTWTSKDRHFAKVGGDLGGIRILRQDPWENLCSFICSTNNNIKRISKMVENLCVTYGQFICTIDHVDYYDFPKPSNLAHPSVESKLRELGFGYRAKYIQKTAEMIQDLGEDYLFSLREVDYKTAHEALLQFVGVGPKVADCVVSESPDTTSAIDFSMILFVSL